MSSPALLAPRPLWNRLLWWLPTVVWLCTLAAFSTDTFSAYHTGSVLLKIFHALGRDLTHHQFEVLNFAVRKTAHFTAYGLLSLLSYYSWRVTFPLRQLWAWRWTTLALLLTLAAASLDEFHQSFVSSRTSTPRDVLLDMMGAVCVQSVIAGFSHTLPRPGAKQLLIGPGSDG